MRSTSVLPTTQLCAALISAALLAAIGGCRGPAPTSPAGTPTGVSQPTATPIPARTQALLIASADSADAVGAEFLSQARLAVQELAASSRLAFVEAASLPADVAADVALVVVLPPDPGLQAWSAAHPAVQVFSLGIAGVEPGPNVSAIAPDGLRHDQLGFALGYLAAMVTPEYRLGALPLDASVASLALTRGFVAGGAYYCGLCRPIHPPYVEYPAYLAGGLSDLATGTVSTLLVAPQIQSFSQLGWSANQGVALVGVDAPAIDLASAWIASARFDVAAALADAWTQAQGGASGAALPLGIQFHSVNEAVVSEGRLRLAEALLEDLTTGVIDTGVDPLTGQLR